MIPRRFILVRDVDVSGISGTGVVAEGIEWSDGTAVLRWLAREGSEIRPTTVLHESVESVQLLHAHGGSSRIEWLDAQSSWLLK